MAGRPSNRGVRARRQARITGCVGFVLAACLPIVLFGRTITTIAQAFRFDLTYLLTGWSPWVLMGLGLLCFIPVALDEIRDRRFYRNGSGAWAGWGVTLYLLGFALATQVTQIAGSLGSG